MGRMRAPSRIARSLSLFSQISASPGVGESTRPLTEYADGVCTVFRTFLADDLLGHRGMQRGQRRWPGCWRRQRNRRHGNKAVSLMVANRQGCFIAVQRFIFDEVAQ